MAKRRVEPIQRLYVEGNNGGDHLLIEPRGDNLIYINVGHVCTYPFQPCVVPVEFITGLISQAMLKHNFDIKAAIRSFGWPADYTERLISQVKEA